MWWTIDGETGVDIIGEQLRTVLVQRAVPEVSKYAHDEELRDLWLTGRSPGLTRLERLMSVSVLVKTLGPQELLQAIVAELHSTFRGTPSEAVVEVHLERLAGLAAK